MQKAKVYVKNFLYEDNITGVTVTLTGLISPGQRVLIISSAMTVHDFTIVSLS